LTQHQFDGGSMHQHIDQVAMEVAIQQAYELPYQLHIDVIPRDQNTPSANDAR
jgi:hypothetical protein